MQEFRSFPAGLRLRLPAEVDQLNRVITIARQILTAQDFREVMPPLLEYAGIFDLFKAAKLKSELYKFIDDEGQLVALRPDITTTIARTKSITPAMPDKVFYCGEVFRMVEDTLSRNFLQLGIEWFGPDDQADAGIIRVADAVLAGSGISSYQFELGSIDIFKSLVAEDNLDDDTFAAIRLAIHRKDLPMLDTILQNARLSPEKKKIYQQLPTLFGGPEVFTAAKRMTGADALAPGPAGFRSSIDRLEQTYDRLCRDGLESRIGVELGITRGYNYYTGMVFEILAAGAGKDIGGGGRYDDLCGKFGRSQPAAGFGLNLDRLLSLLG